jgi:catechol 2,3-dioxygenase-like lactoylglutathione lyase family enzyme
MDQPYDRSAEDLGNMAGLEHVNVRVPDQRLANQFYVAGLGLTRDPFLMVADNNMWVNVGRSQFHLPTGQPMRLRGHTGLVVSDRNALLQRLSSVQRSLDGTCFTFREDDGFVEAVCPWGNRIRCYEPDPDHFGRMTLGMPYVEFDVPLGTARGIASFYQTVFEAPAKVAEAETGTCASVLVGKNQHLVFRETDGPLPPFDGHHIQVYLVNFSAPYTRLKDSGLITKEDGQYQYRFQDIVDLEDGRLLFTIEHEVRSTTHPLHGRPLVNRNPAQSQADYRPGQDQWLW